MPFLDIDLGDFNDDVVTFVSFASSFLENSNERCLDKLKLSFEREGVYLSSPVLLWVQEVVKREIRHLEVIFYSVDSVDMMLNLYLCETLVSLKLQNVWLQCFEFVSLPNLKVMHLEENLYGCDDTMKNLISSCPVLEDLTVVRLVAEVTATVLQVSSQSLNSLKLLVDRANADDTDDSDDWKVIIDAPRLTYLSLHDHQSAGFVISKMDSSAKVEINVAFNVEDIKNIQDIKNIDDSFERSAVRKLLTPLSSVRDMTLSGTTLKIMRHYMKHECMPQFRNMKRLYVKLYICDLEILPGVLECCPNLKSLVVKLKKVMEREEISFSSVPKCLQSSLKYVEIKRTKYGNGVEMKLSKYFLENSLVLEKFSLCRRFLSKEQESLVIKGLKAFKKGSSAAQVNVVVR